MNLYTLALTLHLAAGTMALLGFWTAALARKGSRPHVLAGRFHLLAMLAVLLSGMPLVASLAAGGRPVLAAFLGFLLVLVARSCWAAWRAIRDRRDPERYAGPVNWTLNALVLAGGVAIAWLGVTRGAALLGVFGAVGILAGLDGLRVRHRIRTERLWWLREHYSAMLGNGVAIHIAFLSVGVRTLLPGLDGAVVTYLAWFAPLAAALAAAWWLDRRYGGRLPTRFRQTGV